MNNGLEPCPFCGHEWTTVTYDSYSDLYFFRCPNCGLYACFDYGSATVHYGSKERARAEAIKKWNRRAKRA